MNETHLAVSLETLYSPLKDCFKRPENRMQNAHTISQDCDVTGQRSLETVKETLMDHG